MGMANPFTKFGAGISLLLPQFPLKGNYSPKSESLLPSLIHRPPYIPLGFRLLLILPLVMLLLAASDAEFHLGAAVFEIHSQRHQRETLLRRLARELGDLAFVQQQLARPFGF